MKIILHLTCDFPDPMVSAKTRCVTNLIDGTPGFRHIVYSLNRANWRRGIACLPFGTDRKAIAYGSPPKSLLIERRLASLAHWIKRDLAEAGLVPDLVHAHKLSVEGLLAYDIYRDLGIPYVCSIWGDTDLKFLNARKDLRRQWRAVMGFAEQLLPAAPWTAERFVRDYDLCESQLEVILPIGKYEATLTPTLSASPRFVTILNLDAHKRKNLAGLMAAVVEARKRDKRITLDIFGAGSPETVCDIDAAIDARGARTFIQLKGQLDWAAGAAETLNSYTAFVMPTLRETFGMVFVEALFCGLPILYTQNWSVDGLYPANSVGYAWDGKSDRDLVAGLLHLTKNELPIKQSIDAMARRGAFDQLKKDAIVKRYSDVLTTAIAKSR